MADHSYIFTGEKTLAGRYLRQFWQPVLESDKLMPGQALPIQILNERLTVYRGESGKAYVTAGFCPHRRTQLSTGWVEQDDIRCFYHGWKFGPSGDCNEQPAESKPFSPRVRLKTYPTQEHLGLIFAFLGDGTPSPLPRWPEFETADYVSSMATIPCNYFQSIENIVDDAHVSFAHRAAPELGRSSRASIPLKVSAKEMDYGMQVSFQNSCATEHIYFIKPNLCYLAYSLAFPSLSASGARMRTLFWYVPIDDVSHQHVMVSAGTPLVVSAMKAEKKIPHNVANDILAILNGEASYHKDTSQGKRRPGLIRIQDGVSVVGQGALGDRTNERLGPSDAGVILLRKIWRRELRALSTGRPPDDFSRPAELAL